MIRESSGKISDDFMALGSVALPGDLLVGKEPILFDAGMTYMGPTYLADLNKQLGSADRLVYNFLTHSHFDHAGAAPFLRKKIKGLKTGASRLAAEILKRPNAIQLIQSLSREAEEKNASLIGDADVSFSGLDIDIILEDGAEISLKDGPKIQVLATPGHTRDAISFYIPERKVLIAGEAVGALDWNHEILPNFLSSYKDYMNSIKKLATLEVEILMTAHHFVITGEDARGFIPRSIAKTESFKERIVAYLKEAGGDQEAVVKRIFREDFEESPVKVQEPRPFLINLQAKIKAVAEGK